MTRLFRTRRFPALCLTVFLLAGCGGRAQAPPDAEQQIAAAVTPAPEAKQGEAAVIGYTSDMQQTTLREGSNELVCLADDPANDRFHVACYHESLQPFMKRGRELRDAGRSGAAVDSIRRAEIEAGTLSMPDRPAALYSLTGPAGSFDPETGEVSGAKALYVVYAPFETGASTGLPTSPSGGGPWLMAPGEPWAHIMYTGS
jgi:hypothetical protein